MGHLGNGKLFVSYPLRGVDGNLSGWYKFEDQYLQPEVLYGSWPPLTTIKLGGRVLNIDRPVGVKIRLLGPDEDSQIWCRKRQHAERINLGEYHRDFGDVEVAYSFSVPQTHIWFSGYSIHLEYLENLSISSYNATIRVRPEHVLGDDYFVGRDAVAYSLGDQRYGQNEPIPSSVSDSAKISQFHKESLPMLSLTDRQQMGRAAAAATRGSNGVAVQESSAPVYVPLYSAQVPALREGLGNCTNIEYWYSPEHFNDCEREIQLKEDFDVGVGITSKSSPVSGPPLYPPLKPFEFPELVNISKNSRTVGGIPVNELVQRRNPSSTVDPRLLYSAQPRFRSPSMQQPPDRTSAIRPQLCDCHNVPSCSAASLKSCLKCNRTNPSSRSREFPRLDGKFTPPRVAAPSPTKQIGTIISTRSKYIVNPYDPNNVQLNSPAQLPAVSNLAKLADWRDNRAAWISSQPQESQHISHYSPTPLSRPAVSRYHRTEQPEVVRPRYLPSTPKFPNLDDHNRFNCKLEQGVAGFRYTISKSSHGDPHAGQDHSGRLEQQQHNIASSEPSNSATHGAITGYSGLHPYSSNNVCQQPPRALLYTRLPSVGTIASSPCLPQWLQINPKSSGKTVIVAG